MSVPSNDVLPKQNVCVYGGGEWGGEWGWGCCL